jgi:hypothetical protein
MHREAFATDPAGDGGDLFADPARVLDDREDRQPRSDNDREVVGFPPDGVPQEVLEGGDQDQ